jgi:hypothetical protein
MSCIVSFDFYISKSQAPSETNLLPVSDLASAISFVNFACFLGRVFLLSREREAFCVIEVSMSYEGVWKC